MDSLLGATTHSSISNIQDNMVKTEKWLNAKLNINVDRPGDRRDPTHPSFELPEVNRVRSDMHKADMLEQEEQRDASISHYERLYWESIQEDGRVSDWYLINLISSDFFKGTSHALNSAN